jgi:hypothetical protein
VVVNEWFGFKVRDREVCGDAGRGNALLHVRLTKLAVHVLRPFR